MKVSRPKYEAQFLVALAGYTILALVGCSPKPELHAGSLVFIGDSITSGHGLPSEALTYPKILGQKWGRDVLVFARSGARASDIPTWLETEIQQSKAAGKLDKVGGVFIALGANDQLQGRSRQELQEDLISLAKSLHSLNAPIVFFACQVPLHSSRYKAYQQAAKAVGGSLGPDIISAYIASPTTKLWDGMHPSESGHEVIAEVIDEYYGSPF